MVYRVIIQEQAEQDITDAVEYIAQHNPTAAGKWYRRMKASISSLIAFPMRCETANEADRLGLPLRQLVFGQRTGRYRIVFRILEEIREVHILTVRHGARKPLEIEDIELAGDQDAG